MREMVLGDIWQPPGCCTFTTLAGEEDIETIVKFTRTWRIRTPRRSRFQRLSSERPHLRLFGGVHPRFVFTLRE